MKIALIGRSNVGKSTLFNKMVGKKASIVHDEFGVTRDRKYSLASLFGLKFLLIDTPGVISHSKDKLSKLTNDQSLEALKDADIIFLVIDAKEGVTESDKEISRWIRKSFKNSGTKPVIVIKNKIDACRMFEDENVLGFGRGIEISAEHNLGFDEIYSVIKVYESESEVFEDQGEVIKIAIVGRPNVGKSTLINSIVGKNRLVTSDIAGTTRDSITLNWKFKNKNFIIIDTAGQRKKSRILKKIEKLSVSDAWKYINEAHVILVLLDITSPLDNQDITIARNAVNEGKIVVFVLNKSDLVNNPQEILNSVTKRLEKEFAQVQNVACVLASGKNKLGLFRIFNIAIKLYEKWNERVATSSLNKWLEEAVLKNPPPLANGLPIKIKYASQVASRPPSFVIFANRFQKLPISYERYLLNDLRRALGFYGIPLRLSFKSSKNPYKK